MSKLIRKSGSDLASNKFYNSYGDGKYNPFFPENAPRGAGGTASALRNKNTLGNCTWYAFGRYQEVHGVRPDFPHMRGNAGTWLDTGYRVTSTPQAGGIVVFRGGGYGHVAFIEKVVGGVPVLSESAYSESSNGFLFKYGRTPSDVYNDWGYTVKGYIAPASAVTLVEDDYSSLPDRYPNLQWKVGDIVEFTYMYPTVHSGERFEPKNKNKYGKGYGYINGLFPKDKHPYRISLTKGGATIGATEPQYLSRVNHADIIPNNAPAPSKPKPIKPKPTKNAYGQNIKERQYIEFSRLYADKNGNGGLDVSEMMYQHYRRGQTVGYGYVLEILPKGSYCSYRVGNSNMQEIGYVRFDNVY